MELRACHGTLWGIYQAVVETEDFRRSSRRDGGLESTVVGDRARTKARAFSRALELAAP
jgi:hypothetical protein